MVVAWLDARLALSTALGLASVLLLSRALTLLLIGVLSLPYWLPEVVVHLRFWMFHRLNGDDGIAFPSEAVGGEAFKQLYNSKDARIRSRQNDVGLSDFFWYLLAPAHYIHQEHVESGTPEYSAISSATRKLLTRVPEERLRAMARSRLEATELRGWSVVRLRDYFFPLFASLFHELIFGEEPDAETQAMIVASAHNVIHALKCCTLRDMALRARLTQYVMAKLDEDLPSLRDAFECSSCLTRREQALHIQGVFLHTGCVQLSEAMAHLVLAVAQTDGVQERLAREPDGAYLDMVILEQLRLFPLFGVAHRITSKEMTIPAVPGTGTGTAKQTIPAGSVLLFNYPAYQTTGFENPTAFVPERWEKRDPKTANFIPFGAPRNRPCPGQRISEVWMRELAVGLFRRARFSSYVEHTRSMPDRGPCLIEARAGEGKLKATATAAASGALADWQRELVLSCMVVQASFEAVSRGLSQLVYGWWMIRDSRRLRLAQRYFEGKLEEANPGMEVSG